jgi:ABC-type glycerol-3-phosphate transport system permease component
VGVAVMTVLSLTAVYPLVFVIGTAFKTDDAYGKSPTSLPLHPVFTFLRQAWSTNGVRALANSALVVIPAVAVVVLVSVPAAYALMHMRWAGQRLFLLGMIGMMTVPTAVLMVPLFRLVSQLGLVNSRLGVVLVYASLQAPFSVYYMSTFLRLLPPGLVEAARIDGAGHARVLRSVVVPLARPTIATLVTLNFVWLWNELLFGLLILQDPRNRTVTVGLALLAGQHSSSIPLICAGLLIAMGPVVVVFAVAQRRLAQGLTAGALKA